MARVKERILVAWSGGKDCVLALEELRRSSHFEPVALVTAVSAVHQRVTNHGVPRALVEAQAKSLGLPLFVLSLTEPYLFADFVDELKHLDYEGARTIAFGDVFLDEVRDLREECLERIGWRGIFPLWHRCTKDLATSFLRRRYRALVVRVDTSVLDETHSGRTYDRSFLADLPLTIDPCGENGEFRTFVYDGPKFAQALEFRLGPPFSDGDAVYCGFSTPVSYSVREQRA